MNVNRRSFLKALGGAVALSARGIALFEAEPIVRSYFLPPKGGWLRGERGLWELACAEEALRIVNNRLEAIAPPQITRVRLVVKPLPQLDYQLDSLMLRQRRLIDRVDKLARGWTGYSAKYQTLPDGHTITIHGGRSWA